MKAKTYSTNSIIPGIAKEYDMVYFVNTSRKGLSYEDFVKIAKQTPFSIDDWSSFLHLSERTMQRYKKENKPFDPIHTEKILEIALLYDQGTDTFGDASGFNLWLDLPNVGLGGVTPKSLLDSTFGVTMLRHALVRIENGIPA
ncbi:hypothetical protein GCM10023231_39170 [Olivibacter ginsenosidimutans]|uniref:DUF2384 domain-containing protein n=1 Tax=Olivibacter ginsenosidimutans TaxID=1176537 RepID=A0ABP9CA94_9SPHI